MKEDKAKLWILSPLYFDVESFKKLKENIQNNLKDNAHITDIHYVLVDDSAGLDCSLHEFEKVKNLSVVTPPFNLGHQRAIVFGLRTIMGNLGDKDIIVIMDSDGEDRPEDLSRVINPLFEISKVNTVLAQRTRRRERLLFKIMYKFYKLFFFTLTGLTVKSGNYSAHRAIFLKKIIKHPYFDLCYSSTLLALKLPIYFVPCERGPRYFGQSKMNFKALIKHGISLLMPFLDKMAIRSLIFFSLVFILGVIASMVVVYIRVFTSAAIPGWASFLTALTLMFSFVALGNFLILFSNFSQTQGMALSFIDKK